LYAKRCETTTVVDNDDTAHVQMRRGGGGTERRNDGACELTEKDGVNMSNVHFWRLVARGAAGK